MNQFERYGRQIVLPEIGILGQQRLKEARVLIVGVGGLGSSAALYLAAAGVGTIGLLDDDSVSLSNLQRQVLFSTADIGRRKVDAAAERLKSLNPYVVIEIYDCWAGPATFDQVSVVSFDLVLDCSDNFQTRYALNDFCVGVGVPVVSGAVMGFEGQCGVFFPPQGPCYRCIFPEQPPKEAIPSCDENGVLGVVPGALGVFQATLALQLILEIGKPLIGTFLVYDALSLTSRQFKVERNPDCPTCGPVLERTLENNSVPAAGTFSSDEIESEEFVKLIERGAPLQILDVRSSPEYHSGHFKGAIHIPLNELSERLPDSNLLDPGLPTVVYCKAGIRSKAALPYLQELGFRNLCHLKYGLG